MSNKVFLREVDYDGNPDVVVAIAPSKNKARKMYSLLGMIGHEQFVVQPNFLQSPNLGTYGIFVYRADSYNRQAATEPEYPILVQTGRKAEDENLFVFLYARTVQIKISAKQTAEIPELVVITAKDLSQARGVLDSIDDDSENLVFTLRQKNSRRTKSGWVEVDQTIRQVFIIRPRVSSTLS